VIDAKRTTEFEAAKWILAPGESLDVPGWQISGDTARKFYFTETSSSYAKWLGDTANVGTIEAVFFREKPRPPAVAAAPRVGVTAESPLAAPQPSAETVLREAAPQKSDTKAPTADASSVRAEQSVTVEAERFAATGIGGRTSFPVQWVVFDAQPTPAARVAIRYEFRAELVRLGVLRPKDGLASREQARGFEHDYAPDPDDRR